LDGKILVKIGKKGGEKKISGVFFWVVFCSGFGLLKVVFGGFLGGGGRVENLKE